MTEVGAVYVPLRPSARGFASAMQREIAGDVNRLGNTGGDDYARGFTRSASGGMRGRASAIFSSLASAGKVAAIGAGVVVGKVLADSIGAASDLGETVSKVNQIFGGPQGRKVVVWAEDAADSIGQSQQQALDAAATFATFGKSAGLAGRDLTTFSTDFAALASDLASFHNTTPEESIEAIGAALRGESEPLRRYGVLLDDASLRQTALRLGLVKTTKDALTPQQKVLAAQAEIYRQTADAQGDFERTSDGLANSSRILQARYADARAEIGQGLLPIMLQLTEAGNDALDWVSDHQGDIRAFVGDLRDALEPAITEVQEALGHLFGEADGVGDMLQDDLIPAVRTTSEVVGALVNFVDELPGPVKEFGIQAGLAALVLPKLAGAVTAVTGPMTGFVSNVKNAETRSAALSGAVRGLAGVGGMVALAQSTQTSNEYLSVFGKIAGGAALGFSVAGPWGAAVGAIGGVATALHDTSGQTVLTIRKFEALKGTLDETTAAMTELTRTTALETLRKQGEDLGANFIQIAKSAGIGENALVSAALGSDKAMRRLIEGLKATGQLVMTDSGWFAQEQSVQDLIDTLDLLNLDYRQVRKETLQNSRASQDWAGHLKDFPKEVAPIVSDRGIKPSLEGIASLADQFKALDNKDIKAILTVTGVEGSVKDVRRLTREMVNGLPKRVATHISTPGVDLSYRQVLKLQRRYELSPKTVRTLFKQEGIPTGIRGVAKLAQQLHLVPKDIRTLIKAADLPITVKDVTAFQKQLRDTDRSEANPNIGLHGAQEARTDIQSVRQLLQDANGDRADTYIYTHHRDVYDGTGGGGGTGGGDRGNPRLTPRFEAAPVGRIRTETAAAHRGGGRTGLHGVRLALVLEDGSSLFGVIDERIDAYDDLTGQRDRVAGGAR